RQIVMFGGFSNGFSLNDTWVWDGQNWTNYSTSSGPAGRYYASMSFDVQHGLIVLTGGQSDTGPLNDTWVWNGTAWTNLNIGPCARFGSSMAYGVNTLPGTAGEEILFGGTNVSRTFGDTWILSSPSVSTSLLPPAYLGMPYSYTIPVLGGTPPYTFTENGTPF